MPNARDAPLPSHSVKLTPRHLIWAYGAILLHVLACVAQIGYARGPSETLHLASTYVAVAAGAAAAASSTTACSNRQDMLTISDIYKDDLPDDAIFVLEYPSSHRENIGNPMFLVNSSRYLVSNAVLADKLKIMCNEYNII